MASLEPFNTVWYFCSDAEHCKLAVPWSASWQLFGQQADAFAATCRGCAVSKQQQCMHELAVMFHWASLARTCLRVWQKYAEYSATKKEQWVSLALSVL